jgi:hypothetical protein
MGENEHIICNTCQCELTLQKVEFHYLGHSFSAELLACPVCRQAFITEDVAYGKMAKVEGELEDK